MIRNTLSLTALYLLIIVLSTGCRQNSFTSDFKENANQSYITEYSKPDQTVQTKKDSTQLLEEEKPSSDKLTPYQILNLMVGNVEELSFHYTVYTDHKQDGFINSFYKMGEKSVEIYQASDMNGNTLIIRELEMEGRVHYIIDEYKMIKSYLAPATDFLLYEMMDVTNKEPIKVIEQDDIIIYEYSMPFEHDVEVQIIYRFFIQGNVLKKMGYSFNNQEEIIYEFSGFSQTITDEDVFDYPTGYNEEWYYYINTGEHMPPWWEIGNDE